MTNNDNKTEEQKKIEEKELSRQYALKNIKSALWDYAAPNLITQQNFGMLSESAKGEYNELIKKAPSQDIYEQIYLPQLRKEGGAVTSPYIQDASSSILQQSFASLKVEDIVAYVGAKRDLAEKFKNKYVLDLDKETAQSLIGVGMQKGIYEKLGSIIKSDSNKLSKGLEELVCEPERKAA